MNGFCANKWHSDSQSDSTVKIVCPGFTRFTLLKQTFEPRRQVILGILKCFSLQTDSLSSRFCRTCVSKFIANFGQDDDLFDTLTYLSSRGDVLSDEAWAYILKITIANDVPKRFERLLSIRTTVSIRDLIETAIEHGSVPTFEMLLSRMANHDTINITSLSIPVRAGNLALVQAMVESNRLRGVRVKGLLRPAVCLAAEKGFEAIFNYLYGHLCDAFGDQEVADREISASVFIGGNPRLVTQWLETHQLKFNRAKSQLKQAIRQRHLEVAKIIIQRSHMVWLGLKNNQDFLRNATVHGDIPMMNFLLDRGIGVNTRSVLSAMRSAIRRGHLESLSLLLTRTRINPAGDNGTLLTLSILGANTDITARLLQYRSFRTTVAMRHALAVAVFQSRDDMFEVIVNSPAFNARKHALEALVLAADLGDTEMLTKLLSRPSLRFSDREKEQALIEACRRAKYKAVRLLLETHGVQPTFPALVAAVDAGSSLIVPLLLSHGEFEMEKEVMACHRLASVKGHTLIALTLWTHVCTRTDVRERLNWSVPKPPKFEHSSITAEFWSHYAALRVLY
ncbi:hypothetical protein HDU96_004268 [Phlyctochytrium bullatum]|nr:hypothetical protein HDU96_004268 [Phlyctochytrium bullatum]